MLMPKSGNNLVTTTVLVVLATFLEVKVRIIFQTIIRIREKSTIVVFALEENERLAYVKYVYMIVSQGKLRILSLLAELHQVY